MEMEPSLGGGSQATVNLVSATPPQPLMATTFNSQEDMVGTLIQRIRQEIQKALPQTSQNSSSSHSSNTKCRSVRFNSHGPNRRRQLQTETKVTKLQTITIDSITLPIHQTNKKTETTQTNNHVDIVSDQITSPGINKLVLSAEDWDICFPNVKHHDKVRTKANKIQVFSKAREITIKTARQTPHSNKTI